MLKTLLKVQFAALKASLLRSRRKQAKGGTGRTIGFAVLFLYVIICFFIMFGSMFSSICMPLHELGLGWLYFAIAGLMAFMLTFIGNVFATQTQLFDAKDNELLLSMPIAPKFILGSRMLLLLALDLGYVLLVMGPAGVVYCMNYPVTALSVAYFIISTLLLPLMVQAFSCLVAWVISLISSKMRNKNIITMVVSLLFLAAYFYLYSKMGDIISGLIANGTAIAVAFKKYAFPAYYFGVGIAEHNLCSNWYMPSFPAASGRSPQQRKAPHALNTRKGRCMSAARPPRCCARTSGTSLAILCMCSMHGWGRFCLLLPVSPCS